MNSRGLHGAARSAPKRATERQVVCCSTHRTEAEGVTQELNEAKKWCGGGAAIFKRFMFGRKVVVRQKLTSMALRF